MNEQKPEVGGSIRNIRRFVAFLGIYFILLSQFLIFAIGKTGQPFADFSGKRQFN